MDMPVLDVGVGRAEGDRVQEPFEGMTFESESAGRAFYVEYARRVGFATRVLSSRRSQYENCVVSRALGCRGVLHTVKDASMKQDYRRREGCEAMLLIQREKNGTMWVVRKFVRGHSHPLTTDSPLNGHLSSDEKDKRIQELTAELSIKKRLTMAYKERLLSIIKDVDNYTKHLSSNVETVCGNPRFLVATRFDFLTFKNTSS
ncbi:unnamed protein product [Cuscuta epithymum]|uniref:FAR1 domain-containing protein n=1 Tax=Cuscuta epithymum TaxID=186058 RepID=A0AAV0E4D7_9ASTE|nr:unnamed protein product [Cuscuta epithymum]CAH9147361.1 unnamed protein product [Cuscuta epithymum]